MNALVEILLLHGAHRQRQSMGIGKRYVHMIPRWNTYLNTFIQL